MFLHITIMKVMIVITIFLLSFNKVFALEPDTINVGTVLFSPRDVKKESWSATSIGLLRARRYFQHLLPSPSLIDPSMDNFADSIVDYFSEAVNDVKSQELDPMTVEILLKAISDTIGGYMKGHVIPVAKYGFYGGTVTKEDAQKIYEFYNDIKQFLNTDGSQWREFDGHFHTQIPLRIVAELPTDNIRPTRDYCAQLTYYEETPSGYTIPLPTVSFDTQNPVMYVPLKGTSIVDLESPKSSNALLDYYQAAKKCLRTRSPGNEAEFDNKFQGWLTSDVISHLHDSELLYALGGILTLANDWPILENSCPLRQPHKIHKPYVHINFASKKVMFLAILIFLEIIWCIPALIYMLYTRRKKKRQSSKLVFVVNPKRDSPNFLTSSGNGSNTFLTSPRTSECDDEFEKKYDEKYSKAELAHDSEDNNIVSRPNDISKVVTNQKSPTSIDSNSFSKSQNEFLTHNQNGANEKDVTYKESEADNVEDSESHINETQDVEPSANASYPPQLHVNVSQTVRQSSLNLKVDSRCNRSPSLIKTARNIIPQNERPTRNPSIPLESLIIRSKNTEAGDNLSFHKRYHIDKSQNVRPRPTINVESPDMLSITGLPNARSPTNISKNIALLKNRSQITGPSINIRPRTNISQNIGPSLEQSINIKYHTNRSQMIGLSIDSSPNKRPRKNISQNLGPSRDPSSNINSLNNQSQITGPSVDPSQDSRPCINVSQIIGPSRDQSLDADLHYIRSQETSPSTDPSLLTQLYADISQNVGSSIDHSVNIKPRGNKSEIKGPNAQIYGPNTLTSGRHYNTSQVVPVPRIETNRISNVNLTMLHKPDKLTKVRSHIAQHHKEKDKLEAEIVHTNYRRHKHTPKTIEQMDSSHIDNSNPQCKTINLHSPKIRRTDKRTTNKCVDDTEKQHTSKYIESRLKDIENDNFKSKMHKFKRPQTCHDKAMDGTCSKYPTKTCECKRNKNLIPDTTTKHVPQDEQICRTNEKKHNNPRETSNLGSTYTAKSTIDDIIRRNGKRDARIVQAFSNPAPYYNINKYDETFTIDEDPNNAREIISKLEANSKIIRRDTNELIKLINASKFLEIPANILTSSESETKIEELRACATITLFTEDNSSRQSVKTVCTGYEENLTTKKLSKKIDSIDFSSETSKCLSPRSRITELPKDDINDDKNKSTPVKNPETKMLLPRSCSSKDNDKPHFEFMIEKSHASISVDIKANNRRVSKIPTRVITNENEGLEQRSFGIKRVLKVPTASKIPTLVKNTKDDIVIKSKNTAPDPRLNVTL